MLIHLELYKVELTTSNVSPDKPARPTDTMRQLNQQAAKHVLLSLLDQPEEAAITNHKNDGINWFV